MATAKAGNLGDPVPGQGGAEPSTARVATSSAEVITADSSLPGLREDIHVQPGPRDHAGRPTWTLFDPLRNKFFQFDERGFQLVCCWQEGRAGNVVDAVAARFPWQPTLEDIGHFFDFLAANELLRVRDSRMRKGLERIDALRTRTLYQEIIHNYLFFRVPLVRPDAWLERLYPHVAFLLDRRFLALSAAIGLVSLALMGRQWQAFVGGLSWFFTFEGAIAFAMTLAVVKLFHEMGHALACRRFGVRVASMGVSFIVMWPVLYTDATDGWRLCSRHQRALISAAGVITELVLACFALAAWLLLPDGLPRNIAFTVATTTLVMSLLVNLNPVMRFDGYFFLSDMLNIPNLQERSFALARWQLRTALFGDIGAPPEWFGRRLHVFLVTYAVGTWIYRLVLFLGIALLVYHFFFKLLGIFLFFVEIWFFIARPVWNEMKNWRGLWAGMGRVRQRRWYLIGAGAGVLLLFPWRMDFVSQGHWIDARYERLYPVRGAQLDELLVGTGDVVREGQVLARLSAPDVEQGLRLATLDARGLRSQLERSLTDTDLSENRLVLQQSLQRAEAEVAAQERLQRQLVIQAPFAGRVEDVPPYLQPGQWVSPHQQLMILRQGSDTHVSALVPEKELDALVVGGEARFYAEGSTRLQGVPLKITAIERSAVTSLESPYFAAQYGGDIPATAHGDGGEMKPEVAVYRVHLAPATPIAAADLPNQHLRGRVHFEGRREPLISRLFRLVAGALVREAGF